MTYSVHFRKKVLKKLESGISIRDLADKYDLSPTTIQKWKKNIEPKPDCVRKPFKIADQALRDDVERYPNDYHTERAVRFNCSAAAISKALKRIGLYVKTQKRN